MSWYPNSVTHPEGDEYEELPQPRCTCGMFMAFKPIQIEFNKVYHEGGYPIYDKKQENIIDYDPVELVVVLEKKWVWECSCGKIHDSPPNWE